MKLLETSLLTAFATAESVGTRTGPNASSEATRIRNELQDLLNQLGCWFALEADE